jgi:hypothetical protein
VHEARASAKVAEASMRGAFMRDLLLVLQRPAWIWLVSFFARISGFIDLEQRPVQTIDDPFESEGSRRLHLPLSGDVADIDTDTYKRLRSLKYLLGAQKQP